MSLIEAKDVQKTYPDGTRALRGTDLVIEKGEFVAIMGPSGSGKSTLLHILGFLDSHSGGYYKFNGEDVEKYDEQSKAKIRNEKMGFVFQMFNLLSRTSVLENVLLPLRYSNSDPKDWNERAKKVVDEVGLHDRINFSTSQLSGGEKQRVAIARALINNPDVIFADEPTGNLDSVSSGIIMDILSTLHRSGRTVILITHETFTAEFAERIIRLKDGQIESDEKVKNRRFAKRDFVK